MSVFGRNKDVTCILVPLEGMDEEAAIFLALADVLPQRHDWYRMRFWGDNEKTHQILLLCRTQKITGMVGVVPNIIPQEEIQSWTDKASENGLQYFEVLINNAFAMVYY